MNPLILIHIAAGSVALLAGAAALFVMRKGGRGHARAGTWFFASMLVMTASGTVMAALTSSRGTAVIGIFTAYLVVTSWAAARRRDGGTGSLERVAFVVVMGCLLAQTGLGLVASNSPKGVLDGLPAAVHYVFAALAALAAVLDLGYFRNANVSGVQRISRHLWRMCTALLIAAFSFFLGQQDEFPAAMRGAAWVVPPLAVLATMLFWILRVRMSKAFRRYPPGPRVAVGTAHDRVRATAGAA